MKDEESNNLNESNGSSPQASKKLPYRPPFVLMLGPPHFTSRKSIPFGRELITVYDLNRVGPS